MKKLFISSAVLVAVLGIAVASEKPTPEHVQWMKNLNAQNGAIRKNVELEKNAKGMIEEMKAVSKYWSTRTSTVATKATADITEGAEMIAKAAAASDDAGVTAGKKLIGAGCKGCHDMHRERVSDTENMIK